MTTYGELRLWVLGASAWDAPRFPHAEMVRMRWGDGGRRLLTAGGKTVQLWEAGGARSSVLAHPGAVVGRAGARGGFGKIIPSQRRRRLGDWAIELLGLNLAGIGFGDWRRAPSQSNRTIQSTQFNRPISSPFQEQFRAVL